MVNHVLGGGLSSRLFDEIRERRGLAYSVFSGRGVRRFRPLVGVRRRPAGACRNGARPDRAELDRLVADGITAEELAIAQGYLTGSYEMGLEDSSARMPGWAADAREDGCGPTSRNRSGVGGGHTRRHEPSDRSVCTLRRQPLTVALGRPTPVAAA